MGRRAAAGFFLGRRVGWQRTRSATPRRDGKSLQGPAGKTEAQVAFGRDCKQTRRSGMSARCCMPSSSTTALSSGRVLGPWRAGLRGGWPRRRRMERSECGPSSTVHPRHVPMCMPCPPIETAWRNVRVRGKGSRRCRSRVAIRAAWPNPWRVGFSPCRPARGCPRPTWAKRRVRCARSPSRRLCAAAKARRHRAPPAGRTTGPAKRVLGASGATKTRWRRPRGTALESVPSAAWTRP